MRNQTSFRLTTTLLPTDLVAKTTQVINKVDADGNKFYPTFTEETVVLTNDDRTIMETARAVCENGVLTFTKRGLSDDQSEEQIENRKLTRNPGSLCFITAGAGDWIDKDDDITWTGDQTYTGSAIYEGALTTKKGVKYPSFATLADLEAYGTPFAGMFAVVDATGELYRYNANTQTWAMVSNNEAGQYIIRKSATEPAPGTADNIVTLSPEQHGVFVGTDTIVRVKVSDSVPAAGTPDGTITVSPTNHGIYVGNNSIINKDYVQSLMYVGSTNGAFLKMCKSYGTLHKNVYERFSSDLNYTMIGYGYIFVHRFVGTALAINGVTIFSEAHRGGSYETKYPYSMFTLGPGDIVQVRKPGDLGSISFEICDYY